MKETRQQRRARARAEAKSARRQDDSFELVDFRVIDSPEEFARVLLGSGSCCDDPGCMGSMVVDARGMAVLP